MKKQKQSLTIAVMSDLHVYQKLRDGDIRPSHLYAVPTDPTAWKSDPISSLNRLITDKTARLSAELLLCPGDLGDKADPLCISLAWRYVHDVARALNARFVFASSGNHDLDSRHESNLYSAQEHLRSLDPPYPLSDTKLNLKYWADYYAVVEETEFRLVVLNSCAYHGGTDKEKNHGRIAEATLHKLEEDLRRLPKKELNVLLCHHHPQQHMELKLGDYDVMTNGQLLLDLLGNGRLGRWLIIHGHKHHPKLTYAAGSAVSPIVFSAGSLGANLYPELQTRARNQFYLIELSYNDVSSLGLVGRVKSWDWASGSGWCPSEGMNSGLAHNCGFGFRGDPASLASKIGSIVASGRLDWNAIRKRLPEVDYLLQEDFAHLDQALRSSHAIGIHFGPHRDPIEVAPIPKERVPA